jgi:hypothetical protein
MTHDTLAESANFQNHSNSDIIILMLVFLDESGDTGWKKIGASRYFVVSLVIFDDNEEAEACDKRIDLLRHEQKLPEDFEFHFTENSLKLRETFLKAITPYNFSIITVSIDKESSDLIHSTYTTKNAFYKFACHSVLLNALPYLDNATLTMDKGNSDTFYGELRRYLRNKIDERDGIKIKKIKPQDSKHNNLLQLVDYCVGISARKIQDKKDWKLFYKYIAAKELSYQELPKVE